MKGFHILLFLGLTLGRVIHRKEAFLDRSIKYSLAWEVNLDENKIYFDAIVETTGFVGFGISPVGKMDKADLLIAGLRNGIPYTMDMHGVGNTVVLDDHDDWTLVGATENATHTHISVSRLLNTCDDQDFPITNYTTRVIWSYGETDDIGFHGGSRGTSSFNFLAPELPEWDSSKYNRFDVVTNFTMPKEETTYWCTIHKGPEITSKNHIVTFEALLNSPEALEHTHHFILTMCKAPSEQNATDLFEPHVGTLGSECYALPENQILPVEYCREYLYVWAVGGKRTQFPDHVGYPFGESGTELYYMLEVHYNNPRGVENLTFKTGLSFYYTSQLREMDAGCMWIPHDVDLSLLIPPSTDNYVISAQCAPTCTNKFPPGGITVFNVLLHSHIAGRKMKLRHFRGNTELPWILNDENYDFNFQQNAHLWEEVKVIPGDQLTVECVFDSTDRNKTVITGGYSTKDEMCEAIFWYYPKITVSSCGSAYPLTTALTEFGVTNYTLVQMSTEIAMPYIWAPESLAGPNGTDYLTALNTKYNWTAEFIEYMRQTRQFATHEFYCSIDDKFPIRGTVRHPSIDQVYKPPDPCSPSKKGSFAKSSSLDLDKRLFIFMILSFLLLLFFIIPIFLFYLYFWISQPNNTNPTSADKNDTEHRH